MSDGIFWKHDIGICCLAVSLSQILKLLENICSFFDHLYTKLIGQESMSVGLNPSIRV